MQLWTDYEGLILDGAYPLKRLLLPEGRSAFFSTANGAGEPLVLRLIECHFDQEEILGRWRCLEALNHPSLLKLEHYGPIDLDGGPAVYAVFEKVEANLSEALDRGYLSVKETAQIAACLLSALEMLHNHGFVHEHVEARNVFALGDAVKLRSDCIREAREGEEGREAKRRDIHDAAAVLLQALTQRTSLEDVGVADLPAPFGEVIRNGMNGVWGLAEMRAALEIRAAVPTQPRRRAVAQAAADTTIKDSAPEPEAGPQLNLNFSAADKEEPWEENLVRSAVRQRVFRRMRIDAPDLRKRWIAPVAAVAMLVLAGILFARAWHARRGTARSVPAATRLPIPHATVHRGAPARATRPATSAPTSGPADWRVIVYTYDREEAAQKMAAKLAERHPELKPQVFSPHGRAPYLVAIGGMMGRAQASALARRVRALGLPRDAYAQNY